MGPAAAIPTEPSRLLSGDPALCPTGVQPTSQPVPVPPSAGSRALPSSPRLLSCSTNPSPAPSPGKAAAANPGLQMPPAGSGAAVAESNPKTPQAPLCRTFKNPTVLPLQSRPAASPKTSQPHCVDTPYSPQSNHPKTLKPRLSSATKQFLGLGTPVRARQILCSLKSRSLAKTLDLNRTADGIPRSQKSSKPQKPPQHSPASKRQGLGETPNLRVFCQNGTFQFLWDYCNLKHLPGF